MDEANGMSVSCEHSGSARAIEVAALLGDSVVGVKHVTNPRGGRVTVATYVMLGLGAVMLMLSAIAFMTGVSTAGDNQRAFRQHTEINKRPAHTFRPQRISAAFDFMAFGGAIGGLLCVTMGLLRLRNERVQPICRIGRARGVEFPSDGAPTASFPLVAPLGDEFVVNFAGGMRGELSVDGQSVPLAELAGQGRARPSPSLPGAFELPIPPQARIRVEVGRQSFLIASVPAPRRHAAPLFVAVERAVLAFTAGSAVAHLALVVLLKQVEPDPRSLNVDLFGSGPPLAHVRSEALEEPVDDDEVLDASDDEEPGGTGTAMALDEGAMGTETSTRPTGQFAMEKTDSEPHLAREKALAEARSAGILGQLRAAPGGAFASLTGTADFSSGLDDRDVYGGLLGSEVGEMAGGWGYGIHGMGPGGGGTGWGTIGRGGYGLMGHGDGTGSGFAGGPGKGHWRDHKDSPPVVHIGPPATTGDRDKNMIRRYIRRKLPRIRYCYERELQVKPGLSGTVVTQFQISPLGVVQGASADGLGDEKVEQCVAEAITSIQFPKIEEGGFCSVRYPFTLQPAGQ